MAKSTGRELLQQLKNIDATVEKNLDRMRFVCAVNDDKYKEIMSYNQIMNHIEQSEEDGIVWKFKRIAGHEGPLTKHHPMWKGSTYNVRVEWENGEITVEPMTTIAADDPVTCAIYARDNNLLDVPGWKQFNSIAKQQKHTFRMANQAKLRSFRLAPKYKYGFEIPRDRDYKDAVELDQSMGLHDGLTPLILKWFSSTTTTASMTRVKVQTFQKGSKRFEYTLFTTSNMMEDTRHDCGG